MAKQAAKQAPKWIAENPKSAAMYGLAGTAIAIPVAITGPALAAAGFGANGIAAGSVASGIQAGIGNVAAGSAFATLQSAGMAGYGAAIVNGVIQAGGAAIAVATTGVAAAKANFRKAQECSDFTLIEKPWAWLRDDICHSSCGENPPIDDGESSRQLVKAAEQRWVNIRDDMIAELVYSISQQIESFKKDQSVTEYMY
ncbi:hypothetical protein F4776DRAFT_624885 [Hypoxylon sp. NC0597]|nr:hypothetical protein F4776DRAFT_624885 [Hypoxylon sp. NC0597]